MTQLIFNTDEQLKKDFRKKCIDNGTTMSKVLNEFVKKYMETKTVYKKENK